MVIHKSNKAKSKVQSRFKRYYRMLLIIAMVILISLAFVIGILVHQQGAIQKIPSQLGIGPRDWNLAVMTRNIMNEPAIALDALLHAPELPTVYIDMKFKHFHKIEAKREEALEQGLLFTSDDDFVPAGLRFQQRTIKIKMRLKGDIIDHLNTDKWSYRIHVKGDDQLFGMRRFSIQHPVTRNYLAEWGWLENLRREGILAPRYQFVNVVFNGTPKGIFALEEHFSKELLESQKRREGVIIALDESSFWERWGELGEWPKGANDFTLLEYNNALVRTRRASRVDRNPVLSKQRDTALGLLRGFQEGELPASEVFDASLLGRYLAITELWLAEHALGWNNMNFYYNPLTAKLEPIGFDGNALTPYEQNIELYALSRSWSAQALRDPKVAYAYIKELDRISQPNYLGEIEAELNEPLEQLQLALHSEFPFVRSARVWEILEERQHGIQRSLGATNMVLAYANNDQRLPAAQEPVSDSKHTLQIEIRNILALPVEIVGFQVNDSFVSADTVWTDSEGEIYSNSDGQSSVLLTGEQSQKGEVKYALFRIPISATANSAPSTQAQNSQSASIQVVTRLLGFSTTHTTPVHTVPQDLTVGPLPNVPSVQQALAKHPFLSKSESEDLLLLQKGEWDVDGDLIVPRGVRLQAGPGTTLRFASDAIFFSTEPLEFRGTSDAPVVLEPQERSWSGVVVLEAEEPSVWEHVVVKNTHGVEREGWLLTGGITFYKSPISLLHSRILGSQAEDGINVMRASFEFRESEFSGVASDAFDGDFTAGIIHGCNFHDIVGDAIDISGSQIQVSEVVLRDIGDKALSAGEDSQLEARDIVIANTGIAVASKDLSQVRLERVTIEQAKHAGLAAYTKKPEYGPANITALEIEFKETPQNTLVQTESWIDLNGKKIEGTELDVKAMYEAGILGN